jgi:hypothetical protein
MKKIKLLVASMVLSNTVFAFPSLDMFGISTEKETVVKTQAKNGSKQNLIMDEETKYRWMSLEADLFIFNEAAYLLKLNQIFLDRLPISLQDNWPEMLVSYPNTSEYNKCLDNLLKKDFFFYDKLGEFFKLSLKHSFSGGAESIKAFLNSVQSGVIYSLGHKLEHAKLIAFYKYPGCECPAWQKVFKEEVPQNICSIEKSCCKELEKPVEQLLVDQWFHKGTQEWIDFPVPETCLRPVEGELLGTFKELFFELLPTYAAKEIKTLEDQLNLLAQQKAQKEAKLNQIKAEIKQIEAKKVKTPEEQQKLASLKQRIPALEKEIKDINQTLTETKDRLDKVYKEALSTIEIDPTKIDFAKKLYDVATFVDDTLNQLAILTAAAFVKFWWDFLNFTQVAPQFALYTGINQPLVKRIQYLAKEIVLIAPTVVNIYGYILAQKETVGNYKNYLEALVKMQKKLEK